MKDIKKTEELLKEFYEHREAIKVMISDLESLKKRIEKLFPEEKLDARYSRFFEEKIKTVTGLFTSLLEMRKEIAKNIREEIEIRSKMEDSDSDEEIERIINVRKLAEKIEQFRKDNICKVKTIEETLQDLPPDVKIPGMNSGIIS